MQNQKKEIIMDKGLSTLDSQKLKARCMFYKFYGKLNMILFLNFGRFRQDKHLHIPPNRKLLFIKKFREDILCEPELSIAFKTKFIINSDTMNAIARQY